ncbi:MAG: histidine kinase dimerization/phospho-acceptor domain-containing protein, partial [Myxococcota bacterium]
MKRSFLIIFFAVLTLGVIVSALKLPAVGPLGWLGFGAMLTLASTGMALLASWLVEHAHTSSSEGDHSSDAKRDTSGSNPPLVNASSDLERELIRRMLDVMGQSALAVSEQMILVAANAESVSLLGLQRRPTPGVPLEEALGAFSEAGSIVQAVHEALATRNSRAVIWPSGLAVDIHCRTWRSPSGARFVLVCGAPIEQTNSIDIPITDIRHPNHAPVVAAEPPPSQATPVDESCVHFLAGVSHDMRAPLVTIRGLSEMMALGHLGELNARQKTCQEKIIRYLDHMSIICSIIIDM